MLRVIERENRPLLSKAWHYHPEIEICYTVTSQGRRYVGNNITDYKEKDLVILGPNLPHGFTTKNPCKQYVIQFKQDFLGKEFFGLAELVKLKKLLVRSKRGLVLNGSDRSEVDLRINRLYDPRISNFEQLMALLELLNYLSNSNNLHSICTAQYSSYISISKLNRVKTIFEYIENNFQKDITLNDVCQLVNLTESAFYKFIQRHTNKKFTTILNEYRLEHASKLLLNTNLSISEISFQSGYRNMSYFNRQFKENYNMTPRQLRDKYK